MKFQKQVLSPLKIVLGPTSDRKLISTIYKELKKLDTKILYNPKKKNGVKI